MKIINADALIQEKAWDADTRIGYVRVVDVGSIMEFPALDIRPNIVTKWRSDGLYSLICPICGYRKVVWTNFCPNCGADMRGKTDG